MILNNYFNNKYRLVITVEILEVPLHTSLTFFLQYDVLHLYLEYSYDIGKLKQNISI